MPKGTIKSGQPHFFPPDFEKSSFPFAKIPFLCLELSTEEERDPDRFRESEAYIGEAGRRRRRRENRGERE